MTLRTSLLITATLWIPACAPEDEETEFRSSGTGGGVGTGIVFNTNVFDEALSELHQPMGSEHQGHALQGVELADSTAIESFEVVDGDIVAYDFDGGQHTGDEVIPSGWTFQGFSTWMTPLRLDERVVIDGVPHFRFQKGVDYGSTCHDDGDETIYARLLEGFTLDESNGQVEAMDNNTYVACTNGATGKAAAWGYHDLAVGLDDLEPFELAIRVIRADYCYDGKSYTHPGVAIGIEDKWGVATPGNGLIEAVWGASGLLCRGIGRAMTMPTKCGTTTIPLCSPWTTLATYPNALFMTRKPGTLGGVYD